MAKIFLRKELLEIDFKNGERLSDILRNHKINIETPCNGNGTCGKCIVSVAPKELNNDWEFSKVSKNILACQFIVHEDIVVDTMQKELDLVSVNNGKCVNVGLDCDISVKEIGKLDFTTQKPFINTFFNGNVNINILNKIAELESEKTTSPLYSIFYNNKLLDIVKSTDEVEPLGLSIDLGTTGISVLLVSLKTGEILEKSSFLNPQFTYGGDVLTRVSFCMEHPENIHALQNLVIDKLNDLISDFLSIGHDPQMIYRVVVAGNAIMEHIFAGVAPSQLTKNPYRPIFDEMLDIKLPKLKINPNAIITLLPSIASYVGGDIVAGIVSTGFYNEKRNSLFIDIGTNGEIVLNLDGKLWCTSTAAGPALEGMNISCGQRAVTGAIESFRMDESGEITFDVIGDEKPTGICGSGLIDLIAVLLRKQLIDHAGRLKDKIYHITEEISISQKDVRQFQLVKSSISSGVKLLLAEAQGSYEEIEVIYIAGSFGYHLNGENLKTIGIVDLNFKGNMIFVGNSSLEGARMALINKDIQNIMSEIKRNVTAVELSHKENFQKIFVDELRFPKNQ